MLASGVYAVIRAPATFVLGCPGEQAGRPPPACNVKPRESREANVSLLGQGKVEGTSRAYSFAIPITTPLFPPAVNDWDVRIYDKEHNVVDGIVGIQKNTYVPSIYIR